MSAARRAGSTAQLGAGLLVGVGLAAAVVAEPWLLHPYLGALDFLEPFDRHPALTLATLLAVVLLLSLPLRRLGGLPPRYLMLGGLIFSFQMMSLRLGPLNLLNLGIPLLVLWWLADFVHRADTPRRVPPLGHLLVALGVLAALSVLGIDPVQSLRALLMITPKLMMAWILLQLLQDDADLRFVLRVLILASLLAALLGIAQTGLYVWFGLELHLMEDEAPRLITLFGLPLLRASGLMPNPQAFVHPLLIATMLTAYRWLVDGGGHPRWHPLAWGVPALLLLATALSFARGAWAALACGLLVLPALVSRRHALVWFGALAALLLAGLWSGVVAWLVDAYGDFTSDSADVRLELLAAGLEVVARHPWTGVGMLNFESHSPTLERYPVHNAALQMATEVGLPAFLVFVAILLLPLLRALLVLRRLPTPAAHRLKALLAAYCVFLVAIQGDPMAYSEFLFSMAVLLDATARIDAAAMPAARKEST